MRYAGVALQRFKESWYFEDSELAATHDRKGPNWEKHDEFVSRHGLKVSLSYKDPSWGALLTKELSAQMRIRRTNSYTAKGVFTIMDSVHDHPALFVGKWRNYVYCAQPYDLTVEKYQAIEAAWRPHGYFVDVSLLDAWWYPGRTPLVVISQIPISLTK